MYAVVGNWVLHVCKDVCVNVCGCMWVCGSVGLSDTRKSRIHTCNPCEVSKYVTRLCPGEYYMSISWYHHESPGNAAAIY